MSHSLIRLTWLGSRNAWGRLAAIVGGITLGTMLLLLLAGAFGGLSARDTRTAWLTPALHSAPAPVAPVGAVPLRPEQALVNTEADHFGDRVITRLRIATAPDTTFLIPGLGAPPTAGTFFASPALRALIERTPADQLGARYGTFAGELPPSLLPGPEALVAVVGTDPAILGGQSWTGEITALIGSSQSDSPSYQIVILIGAIGLFFPLFLFVSIVTQLGAAARGERFATLRLIGAGPSLVTRLVLLETLVTSGAGVLLGALAAWLARPLAARFPVQGNAFYPADLAVPLPVMLGIAVAVLALSAGAAWWRLRQAGIGPLGVTRQQRERRPGVWRLLVPVAGMLLFGLAAVIVRTEAWRGSLVGAVMPLLLLGGFVVVAGGLVLVGPLLTYWASGVLARRASNAAGIIAAARVRGQPVATFRSVSGLIVAVFMATVFAATASGVPDAGRGADRPGVLPADGLVVPLRAGIEPAAPRAAARGVAGVTGVVVAHVGPSDEITSNDVVIARDDAASLGFSSVPDAPYLSLRLDDYLAGDATVGAALAPSTLARAGPPSALIVRTDGSLDARERVRTALSTANIERLPPMTRHEYAEDGVNLLLRELAVLAYLGVFAAIATAGLSLAVATASAMLDRKRVLGLLRLIGMPASTIQRIIAYEAAVPLLAVLALSVGMGFLVAWLMLTALSGLLPQVPDWRYFATLAVSVVMALAAVAATFGLVRRQTELSATRFE